MQNRINFDRMLFHLSCPVQAKKSGNLILFLCCLLAILSWGSQNIAFIPFVYSYSGVTTVANDIISYAV